jgi:hypothetical protein
MKENKVRKPRRDNKHSLNTYLCQRLLSYLISHNSLFRKSLFYSFLYCENRGFERLGTLFAESFMREVQIFLGKLSSSGITGITIVPSSKSFCMNLNEEGAL